MNNTNINIANIFNELENKYNNKYTITKINNDKNNDKKKIYHQTYHLTHRDYYEYTTTTINNDKKIYLSLVNKDYTISFNFVDTSIQIQFHTDKFCNISFDGIKLNSYITKELSLYHMDKPENETLEDIITIITYIEDYYKKNLSNENKSILSLIKQYFW
jgi:hypothetical protein